ncbi:MAG: hypothetical protein V1722_02765 [Candidatus Micrarchaeota archaeon]
MTELQEPTKVRRLSRLEVLHTPAGHRVVILPTCSVPHEHLMPENWRGYTRRGNMRSVVHVQTLSNLKPTSLFVKEPERSFVLGQPWWRDYASSREVVFSPGKVKTIEAQATKEARLLLGLKSVKVNAEVPQAIIYYQDGRRAVVTKRVVREKCKGEIVDLSVGLLQRARNAGFTTSDTNVRNLIGNRRGANVIDVNRWEHPAVKKYFKKMVKAIRIEAENQRIAREGIV